MAMATSQTRVGRFTVKGSTESASIFHGNKKVKDFVRLHESDGDMFEEASRVAQNMMEYHLAGRQSNTKLQNAYDTIRKYGRKCFDATSEVSHGRCAGKGISSALLMAKDCNGFVDDMDLYDLVMELLEDNNQHLSVAVLAALIGQKGQGSFKRSGNKVTITLADHWKETPLKGKRKSNIHTLYTK